MSQVLTSDRKASRQSRPISLRVPPLTLRLVTWHRMSFSEPLVCSGISGELAARRLGLLRLAPRTQSRRRRSPSRRLQRRLLRVRRRVRFHVAPVEREVSLARPPIGHEAWLVSSRATRPPHRAFCLRSSRGTPVVQLLGSRFNSSSRTRRTFAQLTSSCDAAGTSDSRAVPVCRARRARNLFATRKATPCSQQPTDAVLRIEHAAGPPAPGTWPERHLRHRVHCSEFDGRRRARSGHVGATSDANADSSDVFRNRFSRSRSERSSESGTAMARMRRTAVEACRRMHQPGSSGLPLLVPVFRGNDTAIYVTVAHGMALATPSGGSGGWPLLASISSFDISTRNVPTATSTIPAGSFQPGSSNAKCHGSPGFGCQRC